MTKLSLGSKGQKKGFMKETRLERVWIMKCKKCGNYYTDVNDEVGFESNKKILTKECSDGVLCCDCDD